MSTHVVTEFHAQPDRGDDVEHLLTEIPGENLERQNYLAWRTERGFTATFEAMLTGPLVVHFYDEVFYAPRTDRPARTSTPPPPLETSTTCVV